MPVQEAIPYSEAIGNGVSKSFALGFPCEKKEYLIVKVGDVQTSEWSLSNNTVTFTTAPELNVFIQFKRETKIERTTDYATYNDSLRGEVLNKDFDKVYEILQENKSDTTQYKPDYEYSVAKANEAHQIASEAYDLAELTEIEHGGTGARNIGGARENLGIYSNVTTILSFNLILHSDSVCDILRSIVAISKSRRVWAKTFLINVAV